MKLKTRNAITTAINQLIADFAKKQGFEEWEQLHDDPTGWYQFGDYTFSFSDIWEDMSNKQAKPRRIFHYQDLFIENHFKTPEKTFPNYKSWLMGAK